MGGGLIQLVAYGIQDIYISGDPQITFFKVVYKRHTNFSIEPIRQYFSTSLDFGKSSSCTIARHGDLITKMYLVVNLPFIPSFKETDNIKKFAWAKKIGYVIIKTIEIEIGGQLIDCHTGSWLNILSELTETFKGFDKMIGNIDELIKPTNGKNGYLLYIPLKFWFNKHDGLALPIVSLQYSEIKLHLEINPPEEVYTIHPTHYIIINDCIVGFEHLELIEQNINGNKIYGLFDTFDPIEQKLYYTKIDNSKSFSTETNFIDPLSGNLSTYPIIGKKTGYKVFPSNNLIETKLNNKLVKELSITNSYILIDYIYLDTDERMRFAQTNHEFLIEQVQFPSSKTTASNNILSQLAFNNPVKEIVWVAPLNNIAYGYLNDKFNYTNNYVDNENIIKESTILLNGHKRFQERSGNYFNWVQPFERFKKAPSTGIYVYSFSLFPEDCQPSGSCNMSKIDDIKIQIKFDGTLNSDNTADLQIYMVNYNVLRIIHGLGGLAFSN